MVEDGVNKNLEWYKPGMTHPGERYRLENVVLVKWSCSQSRSPQW